MNYSRIPLNHFTKYVKDLMEKVILSFIPNLYKNLNGIIKFNDNKITFHDSMLLLPSSLDKLSNNFNVDNKKVIFPIYWLLNNPNFNLNTNKTINILFSFYLHLF